MTLYFPQLSTGAIVQFPVARQIRQRTITNALPDGTSVRLSDPDAANTVWELSYSGLSDAERDAIRTLFRGSGGRLRTFGFLDPFGNLLRWSEDLSQDAWSVDPMLRYENIEGVIRLINGAQAEQRFMQSVEAPGWFRYCFSAQIRSDEPVTLNVLLRSGEALRTTWTLGPQWQTVSCSGIPESEAEEVTCGIEVPAGGVIEVRHLQLEAQPSPSGYRKTGERAGIFREARFDQDSVEFRTEGIENHSTSIRIISRSGI